MFLVIAALCVWSIRVAAAKEACQFPQFMQSPMKGGELSPWVTKTWWIYLRHKPRWQEKHEVIVKNGHIWRTRYRIPGNCRRNRRRTFHHGGKPDCQPVKEMVHNMTCMNEEAQHTYRVIEYLPDGTHRFTCMKFKNESRNVVQVLEGPLAETNDPNLCDPDKLSLDEWPWIANWHQERPPCNISGGYRFRAIKKLTGEDICEEEWRWSTLEIDCMKGDGMSFITPATNGRCNPFSTYNDKKRLVCWAVWQSNDFTFIIASDVASNQPKYCLRFTRNRDGELIVLVYFSVYCPTHPAGKALENIEYYELQMRQKNPDKCEDDDEKKCREIFKSKEDCVKNKTFVSHCPKSCHRCPLGERVSLKTRQCKFGEILTGDWRYYTKRHFDTHKVTVRITSDVAVFSHLSHFQCLERHKDRRMYKTVSLFENGCAPRFTCLDFNRQTANVLQYRISASERSEPPIHELCTFRDDPEPQKDYVRSYNLRNLIRELGGVITTFMPAFCGLSGKIPFNGTVNGRSCVGHVSDWDEDKCSSVGTFSLSSDTCKELVLPMEFQCLSFIKEEEVELQQLVITRSLDGTNTYNCWVLTGFMKVNTLPMGVRLLYRMPTAQCTLSADIQDMTANANSDAVLYLDFKQKSQECPDRIPVLPNRVTKVSSKNPNYTVHTKDAHHPYDTPRGVGSNQSKDRFGQSSPVTASHYTEPPPSQSLYRDSAFCVSQRLHLLLLVIMAASTLPYCLFGS